jgi:hypothetical protein
MRSTSVEEVGAGSGGSTVGAGGSRTVGAAGPLHRFSEFPFQFQQFHSSNSNSICPIQVLRLLVIGEEERLESRGLVRPSTRPPPSPLLPSSSMQAHRQRGDPPAGEPVPGSPQPGQAAGGPAGQGSFTSLGRGRVGDILQMTGLSSAHGARGWSNVLGGNQERRVSSASARSGGTSGLLFEGGTSGFNTLESMNLLGALDSPAAGADTREGTAAAAGNGGEASRGEFVLLRAVHQEGPGRPVDQLASVGPGLGGLEAGRPEPDSPNACNPTGRVQGPTRSASQTTCPPHACCAVPVQCASTAAPLQAHPPRPRPLQAPKPPCTCVTARALCWGRGRAPCPAVRLRSWGWTQQVAAPGRRCCRPRGHHATTHPWAWPSTPQLGCRRSWPPR